MDIVYLLVAASLLLAPVAAATWDKRRKRLAARPIAPPHQSWLAPALAKLGIRQGDPLMDCCPGFSARLEIIRASRELPLFNDDDPADPNDPANYGDLYRVVVTSYADAFARVSLVSRT